MSDEEAPAAESVEVIDPNPLARRIREQKVLLAKAKGQIADRIRKDLFVPPSAVLALTRAEVQLTNLESYARLQEITRG